MFILNDDFLGGLEGLDDDLLDEVEAFVDLFASVLLDEVEFERVEHPLAPYFFIVVV